MINIINNKKMWVVLVAIIIVLVVGISLTKNSGNSKIKIGVITSLSGTAGVSTYGVPLKSGIDLAMKELDPQGTIYDFSYVDYKLDTKEALPAYTKLKSEGAKIFIVDGSPALAVVAPEIRKDGFLSFNPASFIPSYKDGNPRTCRVALTSDNYGPAYAELLLHKLHINDVVALMPNYEAGVALLDSFKKSYESLGGRVLSAEMYAKDATDFRTNIEKLKTYKEAKAIFVVNYFNSATTMFKQMQTLKLSKPIVTDDWTATLPEDKTLLNGAYFVGYSFTMSYPDTVRGREFMQKYNSAYNTRPLINAIQGYDIINIIDLAIKQSGSSEPVDIAQYLTTKMGKYEGVGGAVSFNSDCEAERDITVGHIVDGKIVVE